MEKGIPWRRLIAEGVVIVASVLLALSADAWWQRLQERDRADQHLQALARDFAQMEVRIDSSQAQTQGSIEAAQTLIPLLEGVPDRGEVGAYTLISLVNFAVFSPSTAAYDGLVASGELELLGDERLKHDLAEFYGYFDDLRVTEAAVQRLVFDFLQSDSFREEIGWDWVTLSLTAPDEVGNIDVGARVAASPHVRSDISLLWAMNRELVRDYDFVAGRIDAIRQRLPHQQPR